MSLIMNFFDLFVKCLTAQIAVISFPKFVMLSDPEKLRNNLYNISRVIPLTTIPNPVLELLIL